jgi:subtilisin-like proprotein convertase family protein
MPRIHYGKKNEAAQELKQSTDLIAVRTRSKQSMMRGAGPVPRRSPGELGDASLVAAYPEAGVEVFRVPVTRGSRSVDERKQALRTDPDVRFAGGVLVDAVGGGPVVYTENLFLKFADTAEPEHCVEVITGAGLSVKEALRYATNAYFVQAPEGTGQKVFDIAEALLARADVEYCHPETVRPLGRRAIFAQQWHLARTVINGATVDAHANVAAAHAVTRGQGITVAVIDDGVDVDHPEFATAGKVVHPRDVTQSSDNARPKLVRDKHGTACAGVAVASGVLGASGVAPEARLMPIRFASALGSQQEANAFVWAAEKGADIISCSWGPEDGVWHQPEDPLHDAVTPMPASTRLAIDFALSQGRGGKGCVILFAAGNGNESVDNDGYASHPSVIAVAACNDTGKRSVYSDFGSALWCAFPSNDMGDAELGQPEPLTPGIWTVDRRGTAGYNPGNTSLGDAAGLFANDFGGTSSACPGAAGVAALVLAVNPALRWQEVRDILRRACDRIDPQGGQYNAQGRSPKYGHGRLNALRAVELARPAARNDVTVSRRFDAPIPDLRTVSFDLLVSDAAPVQAVSVGVDLLHTFIGDLVITLAPPQAAGVAPIELHRGGGSRQNIKTVYDRLTTPALQRLSGKSCAGTWKLTIRDTAARDSGTLVSWSVRLMLAQGAQTPPAPRVAPVAPKKAVRKAVRKRARAVPA